MKLKLCPHGTVIPHLLSVSEFDNSRNLIRRNHTVFVLLGLADFTEHNLLKVHPCVKISIQFKAE